MKYVIHKYKVSVKLLMLMSAVILLAACSDDTDKLQAETDTLQIVAYTQDMTSPLWPATTRTVTVPSGYSKYDGSASIGVFMTQNSTTDNSTEMTLISYEDNVWHSMVKVTDQTEYYIYGYMPAYASCKISPNTSFADGAILTFNNVPSVMSEDFSVITGVLQLEPNPDFAGVPVPLEEGTMKAGAFKYTGKASGSNFVNLMFDHLYGALSISLMVDADYHALRTIKLKELRLRTSDASGTSKSKANVTVTLNKTEGANPISSVVFEFTGDDAGDTPFFQSSTGEELTTVSKSFMGHFMPQNITTFVLTSVYDVYDKNDNLIRKDCTAENTIDVNKLYDRQVATQRGWKYNVNMTIKPTYLYMLSDPDLDNPTVIVN